MSVAAERTGLDLDAIRSEFPALHQDVHGKPLVYLDNAATTLKPKVVIDAVREVYERDCANIHRGVHLLSQRATQKYEGAREKIREFIGAASVKEVVFVRGTTEAINLVASSWAQPNLGERDEIVITGLEHHSNIVPWQFLRDRHGARLRVVPIDDDGAVDMEALSEIVGPRTLLVAVAHISNALGSVQDVAGIVERAHTAGAKVLIDGAQAMPHTRVDVSALGADFYAFSGHKMYGPTGVGVLWAREEILEGMQPYQGGGDMILTVSFEKTTFNELPYRFEAGTPNIAGGVGLGAAVQWLMTANLDAIAAHEADLLAYGTEKLSAISGLRLIGTAPHKVGVLSFVLDGVHPHDVGTIADDCGVAIRTGHHCAQPVMQHFGIQATSRASVGVYNTRADLDALVDALGQVKEVFG